MVDLAFEVLKAANTPFYYRDLMMEIAKIKGLTEEEVKQVVAYLYTEINIDGRFACVGSNLWGLKRWYPVDKSEDAIGSGKRPRIINDDDDDLDEDEPYDEEDTYESEEDYDSFDEDVEDFDTDAEDEEDIDEELDDEELGDEEVDDLDLDEEDSVDDADFEEEEEEEEDK